MRARRIWVLRFMWFLSVKLHSGQVLGMLSKVLRQVTATTSLISVAPCKAFAGNASNNEIDSACMALLSI